VSSDRRVYPRVLVDRQVGVIQSTGDLAYCRASDISMGGIALRCDYSADVGQQFDIFLNLPNADQVKRFEARVRVAYVHYIGTECKHRIGMQYLKFKGDSQEVLSNFLSERLR